MFTPGHLRVQCLCGGVWREVPRGAGPMRGQYSSHAITLVQSEASMMISLSLWKIFNNYLCVNKVGLLSHGVLFV